MNLLFHLLQDEVATRGKPVLIADYNAQRQLEGDYKTQGNALFANDETTHRAQRNAGVKLNNTKTVEALKLYRREGDPMSGMSGGEVTIWEADGMAAIWNQHGNHWVAKWLAPEVEQNGDTNLTIYTMDYDPEHVDHARPSDDYDDMMNELFTRTMAGEGTCTVRYHTSMPVLSGREVVNEIEVVAQSDDKSCGVLTILRLAECLVGIGLPPDLSPDKIMAARLNLFAALDNLATFRGTLHPDETPPPLPPIGMLSCREPWGHLIITGKKRIENRSWRCPRQNEHTWIGLHASKTNMDKEYCKAEDLEMHKNNQGNILGK